ncbi:isocitrate lyase/phosphoenolpyruvate mutase family protein [Streptomyces uncialis]|uniref:isocitrate lyase/PEP mutase family protein n=1 Tax=Streptomyces uncialis TaxID=1048205 RepID=UPI00386CD4F1|nr:isocitrate lyase/phosphoenolpyruvate mutase family protein [Streptomyces uncialis]
MTYETKPPVDAVDAVDPVAQARALRALHVPGRPLVLPNAWDPASARLVVAAGALAVATTSAGIAWELGLPDGERLDRDRALDAVARIAAAVDVPVTADIEAGYADETPDIAATVQIVLAAGAVGVNIEDALYGDPERDAATPLRPVGDQAARLRVARGAADAQGVPLFVNARVDTYWKSVGDPATRLARTLERAAAYLAAGADGIFVPGVRDIDEIRALADGVDGPLNILAGPGLPTVPELAALGVARVTLGSGLARAAHSFVRSAAREALTTGTYEALTGAMPYKEANTLFPHP